MWLLQIYGLYARWAGNGATRGAKEELRAHLVTSVSLAWSLVVALFRSSTGSPLQSDVCEISQKKSLVRL